jgi:glutamate-1-semialdehyde 2,1-aminomutase
VRPHTLAHGMLGPTRTFERSRTLTARSQQVLPGGVTSARRRRATGPMELFIREGRGSRLWDVDGNEYVDYTMGFGPLILGHAHKSVVTAVSAAMRRGSLFGAQHEGEIALASALCEHVPNAQRACFTSSGTEAVMLAIRLARAYTGRQAVVRFEGAFHGWSDAIFTDPDQVGGDVPRPGTEGQSEAALSDVAVLPWDDDRIVRDALVENDVAAVLFEPILSAAGCLQPSPKFLAELRETTRNRGTLLIFDEVITGFRLGLGGAQERFGVTADLTVFGKAVAGGLPLAAVTGPAEIMDIVPDRVIHLGTFSGNPLCTAAALATIEELKRDDGSAYAHMADVGNRVVSGLRDLASHRATPLVVNTAGQLFAVNFSQMGARGISDMTGFRARDRSTARKFVDLLLEEGVYAQPGAWYLSTAHDDADVDRTLSAAENALARLEKG